MIRLEPVVQAREIPPSLAKLRHYLPSLRDLASPIPSPHEPRIIDYLNQGVVCGLYNDRGFRLDALEPGRLIDEQTGLQAGAIMTDGAWVWSGVLPYYVAKYHLRLPERFVRFAESRGWKIDPATVDIGAVDPDAYDSIHEGAVAERP